MNEFFKKIIHMLCLLPVQMGLFICFQIHCNAAQSLTDIIRLGREQVVQLQDRAEPDPLLTTVEM